jgi:outer membrane protein OmpA-like peptidoglycan-associated protein
MKYKNRLSNKLYTVQSHFNCSIKNILVAVILLIGFESVKAQELQYSRPSWYFGISGGANMNFYRGTTQQLTSNFTVLSPFNNGYGTGLFLAPSLEYHKPNTAWGFLFQAGLDSRRGTFNQVINACNCPQDLKTNLSYITVEPSLRVAPFKGNFYLYGGPRLAFNIENSFTYQLGINPDIPNQAPTAEVKGEFSETKKTLITMQIGMGYDIPISNQTNKTQWVISPFVAYHPYFNQDPRSFESWSVATLRAGVTLKFGRGKLIAPVPLANKFTFAINSPDNTVVADNVRETFPLRNYVFFDLGSKAIPNRYVQIEKSEVANFNVNQSDSYKAQNRSGRSERSMTVYYNILNILGDRMQKNPTATITLVGSTETGAEDGRLMAESIKKYLVDVFAIEGSRIGIEGRDKPKIPSLRPDGVLELDLLRAGERRVSIESSSPELLMEFRSGPSAPLREVEIAPLTVAPESSYLTLSVKGAAVAFANWRVEVKDKNGKVQKFGPYTQEEVKIPGSTILGTKDQGDYKIMLIGTTPDGQVITEEQTSTLTLWKPSTQQESMRFSVIYEFNSADAVAIYDKYLTEIVTPKIPQNGTVIINGFTDSIGEEANNANLSLARANDVRAILQKSLSQKGRNDVTFVVNGNGENPTLQPFGNTLPEERFYNRTVVIDIKTSK